MYLYYNDRQKSITNVFNTHQNNSLCAVEVNVDWVFSQNKMIKNLRTGARGIRIKSHS